MDRTSPAPRCSVVVYAKQIEPVAKFYRLALDLAAVDEDQDFMVLQGTGIELTVVRIPDHIAADIHVTTPPELREATPIKPSFLVGSLDRVREAVAMTGGQVKHPSAAWRFRGMLHLDGWDPEGNIVQFRQAEP